VPLSSILRRCAQPADQSSDQSTATSTDRSIGQPPRPRLGLLLAAVVFTVLAWASAFVVIRPVGAELGAGPLACGRLLIGSLALGALMLVRHRWVRPTGREWGLLVLCGLAWFALYNLFLNAAERHVDAGTTSMLVNVGPIIIAVLAGLLLSEGFPRGLMAGFGLAFVGVVVIGVATSSGQASLSGVLLCLAAAVVYAVGVVSQKPVLARLPALQVVWTSCTVGAIGCLFFVGQLVSALGHAPARTVVGLVYLGIVPLAVAFSTWSYALARMPAGRLAVTVYAVPAVTVLLGWLFLSEVPPALAFVGGAICLAGVAVSRLRSTRDSPPVEPDPLVPPALGAPTAGEAR
jgi:drug/metabolite transporter (DMT)-like permease